jgi:hypothetical protein
MVSVSLLEDPFQAWRLRYSAASFSVNFWYSSYMLPKSPLRRGSSSNKIVPFVIFLSANAPRPPLAESRTSKYSVVNFGSHLTKADNEKLVSHSGGSLTAGGSVTGLLIGEGSRLSLEKEEEKEVLGEFWVDCCV